MNCKLKHSYTDLALMDLTRSLKGIGRIIKLGRDKVRNLEKGAVFRLIKLEIYSIFLNDFIEEI